MDAQDNKSLPLLTTKTDASTSTTLDALTSMTMSVDTKINLERELYLTYIAYKDTIYYSFHPTEEIKKLEYFPFSLFVKNFNMSPWRAKNVIAVRIKRGVRCVTDRYLKEDIENLELVYDLPIIEWVKMIDKVPCDMQIKLYVGYPETIPYIKNPSPQLQEYVLSKNLEHFKRLQYVSNVVIKRQIRRNKQFLEMIDDVSDDIIEYYLKFYPEYIKKIEQPTCRMQLIAVKRNYHTIAYIKNPDATVVKYVKEYFRT